MNRTQRGIHGVRLIGDAAVQSDEKLDALYDVVLATSDRSSTSDGLAARIDGRLSRLSFSRLRANILLPLRIEPGTRVLDVGCGTGSLCRALAEQGAQVTGLERVLSRARVAAARTAGLRDCQIVGGTLADYVDEGHDGEFDLVLLCGVLGNANDDDRAFGDPAATLQQAMQLLQPRGSVVVALENQLGLKYLLGYPEDRRGIPWVGVDGYRSGHNPARTWSRAALADLMAGAGLVEQQWLYPYPDHMLPTAIVRSSLFGSQEGGELLINVVRNLIGEDDTTAMMVADPLAAYRTMLTAGLGPDTANAFLVVAGQAGSDPSAWIGEGDAWLSSSERSADLMVHRRVERRGDAWVCVPLDDHEAVHSPPLVVRTSASELPLGRNLEDEIVEAAARAHAPSELLPLLQEWWTSAADLLEPGEYRPEIGPARFVRADSGDLAYLGSDWIWTDDVPRSWALLRSLWGLVIDRLWPAGATAGLSWNLTLEGMVLALARVLEPNTEHADLRAALRLESQLQAKLLGTEASAEETRLLRLMEGPVALLSEGPPLAQILERPLVADAEAAERERAAELQEMQAQDAILGNAAEMESLRWQMEEMAAKLAWLRGHDPRKQVRRARRVAGRIKRKVLS